MNQGERFEDDKTDAEKWGKKIGEYYQSVEYKMVIRWLKDLQGDINIRQQGKTDITFVLVCTR